MFNLVTRFQHVQSQAMTAASVVAAAVVALSLLQLYLASAWLLSTTSIQNVQALALVRNSYNYGSINRKPKENAKIAFDLDADLTPLFNWNTKQVFVYLTAEYRGKSAEAVNKVTFWDKIITSRADAELHLRNAKAKYSVWDVEPGFGQKEARLRLEWNIQPHVGPLLFGDTAAGATFVFAAPKAK